MYIRHIFLLGKERGKVLKNPLVLISDGKFYFFLSCRSFVVGRRKFNFGNATGMHCKFIYEVIKVRSKTLPIQGIRSTLLSSTSLSWCDVGERR